MTVKIVPSEEEMDAAIQVVENVSRADTLLATEWLWPNNSSSQTEDD